MPISSKLTANPSNLDRVGIGISLLCLLHCLALPMFASLLPFARLSGGITDTEWFHLLLIFLVVPIGLWAFSNGWKIHRHRTVVVFGSSGMVLVCLGSLLPVFLHNEMTQWLELALMLPGSVFLAIAHWRNYRCRLTHSGVSHPHH